jgi:hypothetical protein
MTESDDSQGLKVAVAAFISLTVILAVTSYFLYSNYAMGQAKLAGAVNEVQLLKQNLSVQHAQIEDLKKKLAAHDSQPGTSTDSDERKPFASPSKTSAN